MNETKIVGWGRRIAKARADLGLSVEQCAARLGITRNTLASWEAERTSPYLTEVPDIARKLNVSASLLVFGRERASS